MSKKPPKKISEKELARRKAAAAKAHEEAHADAKKLAGRDKHYNVAAPRLMRHQGR